MTFNPITLIQNVHCFLELYNMGLQGKHIQKRNQVPKIEKMIMVPQNDNSCQKGLLHVLSQLLMH